MRSSSLPFALGAIVLALLFSVPLPATTMLRLPIEGMTAAATDVVLGEVSLVESRYTEDGSQIMTYVTLVGAEPLKGDRAGEVTLAQWGGQVGDEVLGVFGAPRWEVGERVVVFLATMEAEPALGIPTDTWLVGLSQGKWIVTTDTEGNAVAVNSASLGENLIGAATDAAPDRIRLDAMRQRVREAVKLDAPVRGGN